MEKRKTNSLIVVIDVIGLVFFAAFAIWLYRTEGIDTVLKGLFLKINVFTIGAYVLGGGAVLTALFGRGGFLKALMTICYVILACIGLLGIMGADKLDDLVYLAPHPVMIFLIVIILMIRSRSAARRKERQKFREAEEYKRAQREAEEKKALAAAEKEESGGWFGKKEEAVDLRRGEPEPADGVSGSGGEAVQEPADGAGESPDATEEEEPKGWRSLFQ
jgi:hypothetical protein